MGTLTYTNTLVAGANENVEHLQENFEDISTVLNGNIDATNLATTSDPATILGAFRRQNQVWCVITSGVTAATYAPISDGSLIASGANGNDNLSLFIINSSDWSVTGLNTRLRTTVNYIVGENAPAVTFTWGLYPVTWSGGANIIVATLGTVVSDSTVAVASPAQEAAGTASSSDFALPANGVYVLGVVLSGTTAANSRTMWNARLDIHWT